MPEHAVQVFHADLGELSGSRWLAEQLDKLDKASRRRAEEIRHPKRREQFLLGRMLLCHALRTEFVGGMFADWRLESTPGLKPRLLGPHGETGPDVSLSHSGQTVVCALLHGGRVGVDIEQSRPRDFPALAEVVMTPAERARFHVLERDSHPTFFYRCWTAKEACAKAMGAEQAPGFNRMDVRLGELATSGSGVGYAGITWTEKKYVMSLVCEGALSRVEIFRLGADGEIRLGDLPEARSIWVERLD